MQFDRLYFSVGQIEAEIWAFWVFWSSPGHLDRQNTSRVGPEVSMTERTGRTDNFNASAVRT